ncbi:hypothetical protein LV779_37840 [Streptomyces thinghirensis]|nr:hypothetical protein [Streptomyces thinghirensis]
MDVGLDKLRGGRRRRRTPGGQPGGLLLPVLLLGVSDPSAIRMAGAYATFADSGKQREPFSVTKVSNKGGTVYTHKVETKQAFTAKVADNVTDVLEDRRRGRNGFQRLVGRPRGGRQDRYHGRQPVRLVRRLAPRSCRPRSACSATRTTRPSRTARSWRCIGTGGEKKIHGASFPSIIWQDYMEDALKGTKAEKFPKPEPIGEVINDTPPPSPTPSPSQTEEETSPSPTPSPSKTETSPSPSPSNTCGVFEFNCEDGDNSGNENAGNENGGSEGSPSPSTSPSETGEEDDSRGNQNGGGGFISGQNGLAAGISGMGVSRETPASFT